MFRKGNVQYEDLVLAANVGQIYEAQQIQELLERAGIPALLADREDSGGYLRILGYGSPFGVDVLVHKAHAERAKQLIRETFSEDKGIPDEELERLAMESRPEDEE